MLDEIAAIRAKNKAAITQMYKLGPDGTVQDDSLTAVDLKPSNNSTIYRFTPVFGQNFPILTTNTSDVYSWRDRKYHFALAGAYDETRYLVINTQVMGGPFNDDNQRQQVLKNAVEWLIEKDPTDLNIVIAQNYNDSDSGSMRTWLSGAFPDQVTINEPRVCDGIGFSACIENTPDLMVIYQDVPSGQEADILMSQIQAAIEAGIPLLHVHAPGDQSTLGARLKNLLNFQTAGTNVYYEAYLSNASPLDYVYGWEPSDLAWIEDAVNGIEAESFIYDLSACTGTFQCEEISPFRSQVARKLDSLRATVSFIDSRPMDAFAANNQNRFYAALLLTGDYYRSLTTFPMPKATTSTTDIIRAIFGEYTAVINRRFNPAAPDMGTYSRSSFAEGLLQDADISLAAAEPFKTSGFYALPGETVSVTRTDDNGGSTWIRVNSLSEDSAEPFKTVDGKEFERPSIVSSNLLALGAGETIQFTSAYGGPIHVYFNQDDGRQIDLEFKNVAKHPVWRSTEDTESFLIDLAADEFDWAEFVRPNFELHATIENMQETLNNSKYTGPTDLADATDTYLRGWQIWLDGQTGESVPDNPDLEAFRAERRLIKIPTENTVLHMNSERAACDETCSGNPYESFAPFDPLSLSDQMQAAERLANKGLRFGGASNQSISGLYAIHSYFRQFQETGTVNSECSSLPFEDLYSTIQTAHAGENPGRDIMNADLAEPDQQNAIYIQLMAALQNQGALEDGWSFLPRHNLIMHEDEQIIYRNYFWPGYAETAFCFDGILQGTTRELSRNDWLLVTLSCAARHNLSNYLDIWGYDFGDPMRTHVASLGLPELRPAYYAIPPTGHCTGLDYPEIPVDGVSAWPN